MNIVTVSMDDLIKVPTPSRKLKPFHLNQMENILLIRRARAQGVDLASDLLLPLIWS